jgi:hypothetical protein
MHVFPVQQRSRVRMARVGVLAVLASAALAAGSATAATAAAVTATGHTAVVAWGDNAAGETIVPAGLDHVTAIAAGDYQSLALKDDGTVVAWGDPAVVNVPAGLHHVTAIAAGSFFGLALKEDGTVVAWGGTGSGQIDVPAGLHHVTAIAAGFGSVRGALPRPTTVAACGATPSSRRSWAILPTRSTKTGSTGSGSTRRPSSTP